MRSENQLSDPSLEHFFFSSESVCEGNADKLADQISDAIVDACLRQDEDTKIACETCTKGNMVMILGELTTKARVNYEDVAKDVCRKVGYDSCQKGLDYRNVEVLSKFEQQSPDIAQAVHAHFTRADEDICAGDQGLMFGYATNETKELMPLTHLLATKLGKRLTDVRRNGLCPWLWPDGKTQVTAEYQQNPDGSLRPLRIHSVAILAQHSQDVPDEDFRAGLMKHVVRRVCPSDLCDEETAYHINSFGTHRASGLSGRQIIADTYGGWGSHGGGSLSGKDCSKADRCGTYAARWAAKSLVHHEFCARCLVQVSYAIGLAQPISLYVNSYNSARFGLSDGDLCDIVKRNFDFQPGALMRDLSLRTPQFVRFSTHGHFGHCISPPPWEQIKDLTHERASLFQS